VVTIGSPLDGRIGVPVDVTASAEPVGTAQIASWRAVAYPGGGDPLTGRILGSGVGDLPPVLGQFDPTVIENGLWIVRVEVTDDRGFTGFTEAALEVAGQAKLGAYDLAFVDAEWQSSITKMRMLRSYSTLRKDEVGDFGHGWRLSMGDFTVQTNGALGDGGWTQQSCGSGWVFSSVCTTSTRPHLVLVRWCRGATQEGRSKALRDRVA
jgi:hypothetical protein